MVSNHNDECGWTLVSAHADYSKTDMLKSSSSALPATPAEHLGSIMLPAAVLLLWTLVLMQEGHRADCVRELHFSASARMLGLLHDKQVQRGPARRAVLWWQ
jgi:hypothetical protein